MQLRYVGRLVGICLLLAAGACSSGNKEASPAPASEAIEIPQLAALVDSPRKDLHDKCETDLTLLKTRNEKRQKTELKFQMEVPVPVVVPVFQKTAFDADLGISVPAYGTDPKALRGDEDVAMQYARFGDVKGAETLAPTLKGKLEKYSLGRNYPIEWTRYVALEFQNMINRAAEGSPEALRNVVKLHTQVQDILKDDKAKQSMLGQTLLPLGRRAVLACAESTRVRNDALPKRDASLSALVADAETAANGWGTMMPPTIAFEGTKDQWIKKLAIKNPTPGRVLLCDPPDRGFDLLELPFPRDDAEALLLFFADKNGPLEEVTVVYTSGILSAHSKAASLAGLLADSVPLQSGESDDDRIARQSWKQTGPMVCDTRLLNADAPVGGWVRIYREPANRPTVPRALGPVTLDWSFETNRLHVAPDQRSPAAGTNELVLSRPEELAAIGKTTLPESAKLPEGKLKNVVLSKLEISRALLRQALFRYDGDARIVPLMLPYWSQLGPSDWDTEADPLPCVVGYWQGPHTRLAVRVPYTKRDAEIVLTDPRDLQKADERVRTAIQTENVDRQARLREGKPWVRLPRKIDVPALGQTLNYELGVTRDGAEKQIARSDEIVIITRDDVTIVTNAGQASAAQPYVARQWMMHFKREKDGEKLTWLRVRFESGSGGSQTWPADLLQSYQKAGGITTSRPYRLAYLFGEEGRFVSQSEYWRDDLTEIEFVRDPSGGVEVTLASRPEDDPSAVAARYLPAYLPRGPYPNVALGTSATDLEAMKVRPTDKNPNEYHILPGAKEPWDHLVLTTNENNRVVSIVARHRAEAGKAAPSLPEISQALLAQWGKQLRLIGWPNRSTRTPESPANYNTFTWLDAATRYKLSWSLDEKGRRTLVSEWRDVSSVKPPKGSAGVARTANSTVRAATDGDSLTAVE